jgi:hypothetical protein
MSAPVSTAGEARSECIRRKRIAGGVLALALLLAASASVALPLVTAASATAATLPATLQGTFSSSATATLADQIGKAVAVSGDTALVGAQYYQDTPGHSQGEVYVYVRANGAWALQQTLNVPDVINGDTFGDSVAIDGDTAVIGDEGRVGGTGAVYVFVRSGTSWTFKQRLDGPLHSNLGSSVAVSGDTLLAGAQTYTPGGETDTHKGAAMVYTRSGSDWTWQQTLTADDAAPGDQFGWAVALSGDCAVVGAPYHADGSSSNAGAAYVFTRSSGAWAKQLETSGATGDKLGWSVAASGLTALTGAPDANGHAGAVQVLGNMGSGWAKQTTLTAADAASWDQFGWSVALSGGRAIVGAIGKSSGGVSYSGAVYGFTGAGATWTSLGELSAPTPASLWSFGYATALDGDTMLVGEPSSNNSNGHVYAYLLTGAADKTPPVTVAHVSPAGWTNKAVTVTLTATDDSPGLITTVYKAQSAASWLPYSAPFLVTTQGVTTYVCHSSDAAANLETPDVVFTVERDTLGPGTLALANVAARFGKSARFRYRVNDLTPSATVWIKVFKGRKLKKTAQLGSQTTNKLLTCRWKCGLARGTYAWKVYATDLAGNTQMTMTGKKLTVQ